MKRSERRNEIHSLAGAAMVCGLCILPLMSHSAAPAERAVSSKLEREIAFDIAAQPLDSALLEFSRQANVQVMLVGGAGLSGRSARAVKGRITAKEALASLLADTGFGYTAIED